MAYRINPITCKLDYYEASSSNDDILAIIATLIDTNERILNELKIMNMHLIELSGEEFQEGDVL